MKKLFITLAAVLMGLTAANAQLSIGGSVGFGGTAPSTTKVDGDIVSCSDGTFNFSFAPRVSYFLKDGKLEVGGMIQLAYSDDMTYGIKGNQKALFKDSKTQSLGLFVTPYVRYYFLRKGCFNLGVQGTLLLGGNFLLPEHYYAYTGSYWKEGVEQEGPYRTKDEAKDMNTAAKDAIKDLNYLNFQYGISVTPVMMFNLNEHWLMDVSIDAFGLYLQGTTTSVEPKDSKKTVTNTFNGGISAMSGNVSYLSVGFAYKF